MYDPENIFARILRGTAPCIPVHEDELTLAFMDVMPQSDGHVLVIPKEPAVTLFDLSDSAAAACIRTVRKIALAVRTVMRTDHVFIAQLNGAHAGQTVNHVHFHVIPRYAGVPLREHARVPADRDRLAQIAQQLVQALGGRSDAAGVRS